MAEQKQKEQIQALALAEELGLPAPVRQAVAAAPVWRRPDWLATAQGLTNPSRAAAAWRQLEAALAGDDPDGMALFTLYLAAACTAREINGARGIPDDVFLATMGCFGRFLQEARVRCGRFCFDRAFWAWRQLSGQLFRLGTLEFEYRLLQPDEPAPPQGQAGTPVLSVHIPSDAVLTEAALADSYARALPFFAQYGAALAPAGAPQTLLCHSWLLSPGLYELLPAGSGIRRFADGYRLYASDPDDSSFYEWLFAGRQPPQPLPQTTSLQRAVCAYLQAGGRIGSGYGIKL